MQYFLNAMIQDLKLQHMFTCSIVTLLKMNMFDNVPGPKEFFAGFVATDAASTVYRWF